ncbi:MAG: hypothetical protein WC444_04625 [Candidatus Paceibacterota bacterium]
MNWLKKAIEEMDKYADLFVVSYVVRDPERGNRNSGAYLVRAKSKLDAIQVVKNIAEDYFRVSATPADKYYRDDYDSVEEALEGKKLPAMNKYLLLYSGT